MAIEGKQVLVVEDETAIRQMVEFALVRAEFSVEAVEGAADARLSVAKSIPDLILLDWMMPGTSGIELAREFKANPATSDIPIIMLTARAEEDDKVRGLEVGCDDYISKPFSVRELVARVNAVLRRTRSGASEDRIRVGSLEIDPAGQRVTADGRTVKLGPTEYRLLHFFATHAERVYSREQVLDRVWGREVYVEERTVDVHIRRLRKALEPYGHDSLIQTVRGSGYRFSEIE